MTLIGSAFMGIWHEVDPASDDEYNSYHTVEHIPERVGLPGFTSGRRYVESNRDQPVYFTVYSAYSADVFASQPYRARLDSPTDWTKRMQPSFRHFTRAVYEILSSHSNGIGGALAIVSCGSVDDRETFYAWSRDAVDASKAWPGVTGLYCGWDTGITSSYTTNEEKIRHGDDQNSAPRGLVLIEAVRSREAEAGAEKLMKLFRQRAADTSMSSNTFALSVHIASENS
jgi:hypothetical protein